MKKFFQMLFPACFAAGALMLAGCGNGNDKKQVLRMATDAHFPPYESFVDGKIVGIDVDVVREIIQKLGYELDVIDMKLDAVVLAVEKERCDIGAATLTITEERKERVAFSIPYATAKQIVIVTEKSTLATKEELKNDKIKVGVQRDSASDSFFTRNFVTPIRFDDVESAVEALLAGKLDAVTCDDEPANIFVAKHAGKLRVLPFVLTEKQYAFAFNKKNQELLGKFNAELEKMKSSGRLQQIVDSYLKK